MRSGVLAGLESPSPLGPRLPGIYLETEEDGRPNLGQRFLSALDDVLAPVFLAADSLPAYLDPELTPEDFLDWLGGWLGLALDERWSLDRRRELVARAASLYQLRGTAEGVAQHVEAFAGVRPDVTESGGVSWSTTAEPPLPGGGEPKLTVRMPIGARAELDVERLRALVESIKPAHVVAEVIAE